MKSVFWNPWHGCVKYSEGCAHCYVFELDEKRGVKTTIHKNESSFTAPIKHARIRDTKRELYAATLEDYARSGENNAPAPLKNEAGAGAYSHPSGTLFATCFTSDFFLEQADEWRAAAWNIIRARRDCVFEFFTKRILRARECLPDDWGEGYPNVHIYVSVENQKRADERLRALIDLPAVKRGIVCAPLLEQIRIDEALASGKIDCVSAGGEAYRGARACDFSWVLALRDTCVRYNRAFTFHQTGARFIKDGREYSIPSHKTQLIQARKANIDYSPTINA